MELRQLRYFVAVAEEEHFSHAASREFIASSSVSEQIKALERDLGAMLFERTSRHVRLTEAGRALLTVARHILDDVDTAREAVTRTATGSTGTLRLGWPPVGEPAPVDRIVSAFRRTHPDVEVVSRVLSAADATRAVADGDLDVAFVHSRSPSLHLEFASLQRREFKVALAAGHPLASRPVLTLHGLRHVRHVVFPRRDNPPVYHYLYDELLGGVTPAVEHGASLEAVLGIVAASDLVALRFEDRLPPVTWGGVVYRPVASPAPYVDLGLTWRTTSTEPLVAALEAVAVGIAQTALALPNHSEEPNEPSPIAP